MTIYIEPSYSLTPREVNDLKILCDIVTEHDAHAPMMYWSTILNRLGDQTQDFLLRDEEKIIGYLGWFNFGGDAIEICAFVHPDYRRRQYFTRLLATAKQVIRRESLLYLVFAVEHGETPAIEYLRNQRALEQLTQWDLVLRKRPNLIEQLQRFNLEHLRECELRVATLDDLPLLASLDEVCFGSDYDDVMGHYLRNFAEPERCVWLLYYHGVSIGKIHIRLDWNDVVIHDFCVLPGERGQGLGKYLLIQTIDSIFENYAQLSDLTITLEADNPLAATLYQSLGFETESVYTYWRCELGT